MGLVLPNMVKKIDFTLRDTFVVSVTTFCFTISDYIFYCNSKTILNNHRRLHVSEDRTPSHWKHVKNNLIHFARIFMLSRTYNFKTCSRKPELPRLMQTKY